MTVHHVDNDPNPQPVRQDMRVGPLLRRSTAPLALVALGLLGLAGAQAAEPAAPEASPALPAASTAPPAAEERDAKLASEAPPPPAPPSPAVLALGRHLARDCASCHRIDGVETGIPGFIGWPAERLAAALDAYRTGGRRNPVMGSVARTLSPAQVEALGAYYASLGKR